MDPPPVAHEDSDLEDIVYIMNNLYSSPEYYYPPALGADPLQMPYFEMGQAGVGVSFPFVEDNLGSSIPQPQPIVGSMIRSPFLPPTPATAQPPHIIQPPSTVPCSPITQSVELLAQQLCQLSTPNAHNALLSLPVRGQSQTGLYGQLVIVNGNRFFQLDAPRSITLNELERKEVETQVWRFHVQNWEKQSLSRIHRPSFVDKMMKLAHKVIVPGEVSRVQKHNPLPTPPPTFYGVLRADGYEFTIGPAGTLGDSKGYPRATRSLRVPSQRMEDSGWPETSPATCDVARSCHPILDLAYYESYKLGYS